MKWSTSNTMRALDIAGRVLLTVVAVGALLGAVSFAALRGGFAGGKAGTSSSPARGVPAVLPGPSARGQEPRGLWPRFPGSGPASEHQMIVDGAEVISEQWETTASASELLEYYRGQMACRGWHDVTESELNLEPETQVLGGEKNALQNEKYLRIYEEKMESCLILRRDPWSMQIEITPGSNPRQRAVSFFAVSRPSVREFSEGLAGRIAAANSGTDENAAFESSERFGGTTYNTIMRSSPRTPAVFFAAMLDRLVKQGWRLQVELPSKPGGDGEKFALLESDREYGCLIVSAGPDGRGASAVFTRALGQ